LEIKSNEKDKETINNMANIFKECPIPVNERLNNLGLFIKRQQMSRFMVMWELYKQIINVHGSIIEFGVRWGQDLTLFESFRGMLEPFNYNRKIIGFDTFSGFPSVSEYDGNSFVGDMDVTFGYKKYLDKLLQIHENNSPISQIKKYELVKGDATQTFEEYLNKHPELIVAFVYYDFDIYEPTKICLELCKKRLVKGSIVAFDEVNHPDWPGETQAFREIFDLNKVRLQRFTYMPTVSYFVVE